MTEKQQKIYNIIKKYIEKNKYAPTIREIRDASGLKSTSTIEEYLIILKQKGYIDYVNGKSRTITILK